MISASRRLSTRKFLTNCQIELTRALIRALIEEGEWSSALDDGDVRLADKITVNTYFYNGFERISDVSLILTNLQDSTKKKFYAEMQDGEVVACIVKPQA